MSTHCLSGIMLETQKWGLWAVGTGGTKVHPSIHGNGYRLTPLMLLIFSFFHFYIHTCRKVGRKGKKKLPVSFIQIPQMLTFY